MNIEEYKNSKGFIGLIALLISVAIIAFIIVKTDLFTGQKNGKNMIEQGKDAVGAAENAKKLMEQDSKRALGE